MSTQPPLSVEVCNVLHRVILTKNASIKHLAFNVLLTLVFASAPHSVIDVCIFIDFENEGRSC